MHIKPKDIIEFEAFLGYGMYFQDLEVAPLFMSDLSFERQPHANSF